MQEKDPLTLAEAIQEYLDRFANPETVRAYRHALIPFAEAVGGERDIDTITPLDIQRYFNRLNKAQIKYEHHPRKKPLLEPLSPGTLRKHRKTFTSFFSWLARIGAVPESPMKHVDLVLRSAPDVLPGAEEHVGARVATTTEIAMLIRAAEKQRRKSMFLLAIVLFFVDTGARREGVATLRLSHLYLDAGGKKIVQNKAIVTEKGKVRPVWFGESTREILEAYLAERPNVPHDYVFCGRYAPHDPIQKGSMADIIERLAHAAGISGPFAPHAIRRWRIDSLKSHVDERTRQFIAGHSENSPVTQKHYTFINEQDVEQIVRETSWHWQAVNSPPIQNPDTIVDFLEWKRKRGS